MAASGPSTSGRVGEVRRGAGSTFRARVDVVEVAGQRDLRLHPPSRHRRSRDQLRQLERDLDGEALHTSSWCKLDGAATSARAREARDLGRRLEDAPLRPRDRGQPHRRPASTPVGSPLHAMEGPRPSRPRPADPRRAVSGAGPACARPTRHPRSRRRAPAPWASSRRPRRALAGAGARVAAHDPGPLHHHVRGAGR